jgi:aspartoacylase
MPIKNVAIVGGTHGNEWTGIYLLKRWEKKPSEILRPSFSTNTFFGNPKAFEINRRFVDQDLNRSFSRSGLQASVKTNYESQRAAFLNDQIGPKGNPKHDFIIDLHTSTSNCGAMLIVSNRDTFNLQLAAYVTTKVPNAHIWYAPPAEDPPYLSAITNRNLGVEIGPIAQGPLQMNTFRFMNEVVSHTLDFVHGINEGHFPELPTSVEIFKGKGPEFFPKDKEDDQIIGMIHPSLQGRDYYPLQPGAPMFETLNDGVVPYSGSEPSYPVFINEAAYYQLGIAFFHCKKENVEVPPFCSSHR